MGGSGCKVACISDMHILKGENIYVSSHFTVVLYEGQNVTLCICNVQ